MMKLFYKLNLIFFLLFSFNSISNACDFTKIAMGTQISSIEDKYDDLSVTNTDDYGDSTVMYTYDTSLFCDDDLLKNTFVNIYIKEKKLIGIQIEGIASDKNTNEIYKFAKNNFGLDNDQAKSAKWVGAVDLSSDINSIIYGKVMGFDGIHEALEISSFEYADFLIDGDIVEAFQ